MSRRRRCGERRTTDGERTIVVSNKGRGPSDRDNIIQKCVFVWGSEPDQLKSLLHVGDTTHEKGITVQHGITEFINRYIGIYKMYRRIPSLYIIYKLPTIRLIPGTSYCNPARSFRGPPRKALQRYSARDVFPFYRGGRFNERPSQPERTSGPVFPSPPLLEFRFKTNVDNLYLIIS